MEATAAGAPPLRRSLQGLAWNDPIVATYRDAVGQMKVMAESEKFSWANMSKVHGLDPGHYHYCPHGDWHSCPGTAPSPRCTSASSAIYDNEFRQSAAEQP